MITPRIDNTKVVLSVDLHVPGWELRRFDFIWETGTRWAAGFMYAALNKALCDALVTARRKAYEQGWSDAKAKRAKEDFFSHVL